MLLILDDNFKELFQKDIQLTLKNKPYKKGKLINFKVSGCYISLVMLTEKKKETFEIPFPFAIKNVKDKIIFDYTLETLAEQDYDLLFNLKATSQVKKCKFYNATLSIIALN
jgi:hypothetical protein